MLDLQLDEATETDLGVRARQLYTLAVIAALHILRRLVHAVVLAVMENGDPSLRRCLPGRGFSRWRVKGTRVRLRGLHCCLGRWWRT